VNFAEAFNSTMKKYGLTAKELSGISGVGENVISLFRNGKNNTRIDIIMSLLEAMPAEARVYFFTLLTQQAIEQGSEKPDLTIRAKSESVWTPNAFEWKRLSCLFNESLSKLGINIESAAKLTGLSVNQLSELQKGNPGYQLSLKFVEKLAVVLYEVKQWQGTTVKSLGERTYAGRVEDLLSDLKIDREAHVMSLLP
jgi:transcriptional regulator with XRE-family HTH domain